MPDYLFYLAGKVKLLDLYYHNKYTFAICIKAKKPHISMRLFVLFIIDLA